MVHQTTEKLSEAWPPEREIQVAADEGGVEQLVRILGAKLAAPEAPRHHLAPRVAALAASLGGLRIVVGPFPSTTRTASELWATTRLLRTLAEDAIAMNGLNPISIVLLVEGRAR